MNAIYTFCAGAGFTVLCVVIGVVANQIAQGINHRAEERAKTKDALWTWTDGFIPQVANGCDHHGTLSKPVPNSTGGHYRICTVCREVEAIAL